MFAELGLNMTTAFNMFLRQSVREGCIPFKAAVNMPNAATITAMFEAERIADDPNAKKYGNVEVALRELKS